MYPSICFACDSDPRRARSAVGRMLAELGALDAAGLKTACGPAWAGAVVPPPGGERFAGAGICSDGGDVLLLAGEIFIPDILAPSSNARGTGFQPVLLLKGLQKHGIRVIGQCDGAFCGAWYEGSHARWHIFNDRFGLLPVFWSDCGDRLLVGPRAAAVAGASDGSPRIDPMGVAGLLRTQNMINDGTLLAGVRWLQRGHALTWRDGSHALRPMGDFQEEPSQIHEPRAAADAYVDALEGSLRRHAQTDAPLLLGISGGLDSRLFLAALAEMRRVPACFSAGLPFASDVRFGRQLARTAGAAHEWVPLQEDRLTEQLTAAIIATDGLHNAGHLPPAGALREYLRGHAGSVLLEGFFNGVAGGATIPGDHDNAIRVAHQQPWAARLLHSGGPFALIDELLEPRLADESRALWQENVNRAWAGAGAQDPLRRAEYAVQSARRSRMDTLGTALLRADLPVRNPAADLAMVRWFQAVPPALRRARCLFLEVLRRRFPRFARVPRSDTGGMPISRGRWRREYHWQREKFYRWWAGRRYPALRRWGGEGAALRAWTFETLHRRGALDMLLESDARILEWTRRDAVRGLWSRAVADPLQGMPLLGLWTVETMVRWLESRPRSRQVPDQVARASRWPSRPGDLNACATSGEAR